MEIKHVKLPLDYEKIIALKAGDRVLLTGYLYTARDAAHKRLKESLEKNETLPFDLSGQTLYYVGPAPAKPGYVVGPAGPTTSYRMDPYTPALLDHGLKGMIGKGIRNQTVIDAIIRNQCVYFAAVGGAAALISKTIKSKELIDYEDLGTEAIFKLYVEEFPVVVVIDAFGNNLYQ
ncbi:MAG: Fe-S-containing hydro-lyase [Tissierellales bacterium]|nr:Fe-S-containing hydro-lyase [Tissierellales bacterium]MBN2827885.1 Fe-S-containing hydro-lyase [Tissierellales bacterium]